MKQLLWIALCGTVFGQGVTLTPKVTATPKTAFAIGAASVSIVINSGGTSCGTSSNQVEDPATFVNDALWVPVVLQGTNPTMPSTFNVCFETAQPGTWSVSLYGPGATGQIPDTTSKICTSSNQTNGATLNGWVAVSLSGCPGSLTGTAGTVYWLGVTYTSTTTQMGNTGFQGYCPYWELNSSTAPVTSNISASTITPWPSTAPTSLSIPPPPISTGCYAIYVPLTYSTSHTYDIVSYSPTNCDTNLATCKGSIPPTTAGHGFMVIATSDNNSGTITGVVDTTNGTTTDTLTQVGCTSSTTVFFCMYWIDRVTVGVNGVTCTRSVSGGSYKVACTSIEINGTNASSAVDKSHFDSALINSASFTSGNTATTTQANELLIGFAIDSWPGAQNVLAYTVCGGSWTTVTSTLAGGNAPSQQVLCIQPVTSTGAYNLSGTSNAGAGSNNYIPGLVTIKQ